MRYVISGSRRIKDYSVVKEAIESAIEKFGEWPSLIIEGGQRTVINGNVITGGVDWWARCWAVDNDVPFRTERAKWGRYGLAAGPIRNRRMAKSGDVLVAVPDKQSKGTRDMISAMKELEKPVFVMEAT